MATQGAYSTASPRRQPQRLLHDHPIRARQLQGAQSRLIQPGGVQHDLAVRRVRLPDRHLPAYAGQAPGETVRRGIEARQILAHDQLSASRRRGLRLIEAFLVALRRVGLARPLVDLSRQRALQGRALGGHQQLARVASHGVAVSKRWRGAISGL